MRISCGRYEDTLCPGKSRKFPTRKDPRPVGFEPTTLSLVLLNSCAFTATAIWAPIHKFSYIFCMLICPRTGWRINHSACRNLHLCFEHCTSFM
uniref:Uncharacterized protein n=1 Tax=Aedes aegypti TaxID=7159 RepID=A0A0P6IRZ2_AEDAE